MWSHYAAKHRGFALEFGSGGDFFGNILAVNYSDPRTSSDPRLHDALQIRGAPSLAEPPMVGQGERWVVVTRAKKPEGTPRFRLCPAIIRAVVMLV